MTNATPRTIVSDLDRTHTIRDDGFLVDPIRIEVDLGDIIDLDFEGFLDLISERAGFALLMQQSYEIVGHTNGSLFLHVLGDVSWHLEEENNR
jgi:hypothetical protein